MNIAKHIIISGRVQGVGFRPFIYRLATHYNLNGYVYNGSGQVQIYIEGKAKSIDGFVANIIKEAPPLARPVLQFVKNTSLKNKNSFKIKASQKNRRTEDKPQIHIPPDLFLCPDCLHEIETPKERRFGYAFTNCTQCGPRYTLITAMPYDRPNTSMAGFALCTDCKAEYENPSDRRFHAEPLACEACGPSLNFVQEGQNTNGDTEALTASLQALRNGLIIAVKGVGGYHLMCDAKNNTAVLRLRARKHRPDKPLAVMFPLSGKNGMEAVEEFSLPSNLERQTIFSPERPIVLVAKHNKNKLAKAIAPKLAEIGVFLPYAPLHHLLLDGFDGPLVATSGNISGEAVITNATMAEQRLGNIADGFLHHNRPIVRHADDSVMRVIASAPRPIRLGRGFAPLELGLHHSLPHPVLATGGHLKNTIALAWNKRVVVSPHIGNLDSVRALQVFEQTIDDLQNLYGVRTKTLIVDAHTGYASHRWAARQNLPLIQVQHHRAHASAVAGEHPHIENWLVFTWDGVGLGDENTLWGGEGFYGHPGAWQRVSSWREFTLSGGDKAGREPWRSASALMWGDGQDWAVGKASGPLAKTAWQKKIVTHQSSAIGRLFDAATCLITGLEMTSYEGQAPMLLENLARMENTPPHSVTAVTTTQGKDGIVRSDWAPLLPILLNKKISEQARSSIFHVSLATALVEQVLHVKKTKSFQAVGLSGGVFQNRILSEMVIHLLAQQDIKAYLPQTLPVNDGGLAYGQVIEVLNGGQNEHI